VEVHAAIPHTDDPRASGIVGIRSGRPVENGLHIAEPLAVKPIAGIGLAGVDQALQFIDVWQPPVLVAAKPRTGVHRRHEIQGSLPGSGSVWEVPVLRPHQTREIVGYAIAAHGEPRIRPIDPHLELTVLPCAETGYLRSGCVVAFCLAGLGKIDHPLGSPFVSSQ